MLRVGANRAVIHEHCHRETAGGTSVGQHCSSQFMKRCTAADPPPGFLPAEADKRPSHRFDCDFSDDEENFQFSRSRSNAGAEKAIGRVLG